jgi:two-component system KDP operon response regulator KdpE
MNYPSGGPLVLVIEDDPQMRRLFASTLAAHGMRSMHAATQGNVRSVARDAHDIVLLDTALPGTDYLAIVQSVRARTAAPIVALLNLVHDAERAAVLAAGANDYLVRPFSTEDLVARLRVWLKHRADSRPVLRRSSFPASVWIDRERKCVFVEGVEVHVTPLEYKLLDLLLRGGAEGLTEEQLVRALWGPKGARSTAYFRAQVRQLRQKIEADPARPRYLLTEPGGAYRLKLA